jgi:membrane-associated phospholipid phosphatase
MRHFLRGILVLVVASALLPHARAAYAGDSPEVQIAKGISDTGILAVMAGAVVLPLFEDKECGKGETLRTVDAIVSASLVTIALKRLVREPRPNGQGHDSFPSGHATAAFAAATLAADRHPDQAPYWYGAAALIAYSRVRLNLHRPSEVVAGALIGFGMAKLEQRMPRGLLIAPFINPDADGGGVQAVWNF